MKRTSWTDERLDEKMDATTRALDRLHDDVGGLRDDVRAFHSDFAAFQGRMTQIGFGLVGVLLTVGTALIIAVA